MNTKRKTTALCLSLCLATCHLAGAAAPISACRPAAGHLRIGAQVRGLELDAYEYDNREIAENTALEQENLILEYGLTDSLFVALRFGTISWDPDADDGRNFDEGTGWGFGVGGAVPVYAPADSDFSVAIGWDFFYDHAEPDPLNRANGDVIYGDVEWWQTSLAGHCTWRNLCGYLGTRYTQVDLTYTHDSRAGIRRGGFQEDEPVNFFAGAGATFFDAIVLRGEWQFTDIEVYEVSLYYNLPLGGRR